MQRPLFRRAAAAACVLVALAVGSAAADPGDRLDRIAKKRARIAQQRQAAQAEAERVLGEIRVLDQMRARAEKRVSILDARLGFLDVRIGIAQDRLTAAQQDLALLTRELLDIQASLVARTDVFVDRAVAAYINGPTAYFDAILSAQDFGDLVDRYTYYESALDSDARLLEEIQTLRDATTVRRDAVEEKRAEILSSKQRLEADRRALHAVRSERAAVLDQRRAAVSEKEALLGRIEDRKAELEALDAALAADAARIQGLLSGGSTGNPAAAGQLLWPANGPVTSGYGYRTHPIFGDERLHTGIDIGAPYGSPVVASDAGIVAFAGVMSGYGNVVVLDHGGGLATTYNHLSAFYVSDGQEVGRGSQIGAVGCTGYCTGPHLHFEVRVNGNPVDPMPYLP